MRFNKYMAKTQKELAFLRDLYVQDEWTKRFTDLADKHMDLRKSENMLYINAGTGGHALSIEERFGEKANIFATTENEDLLTIARDKAAAVRSSIDFSSLRFEDDAFDAVLADASLVRPAIAAESIENAVRVARTGGDVAVFLPTAGSFGEIFSLMWEVLVSEDLAEHGAAAERLITDLPTIGRLEEIGKETGLVNINTQTVTEAFEYENGEEFIASPLIADFLLPDWLEMLDEDEKERAAKRLAKLIDAEDGDLAFRFTVKATLLTGEKG
ncbi:MAG: class I SAM-dependent methyltransferase [Acidobacteriota bacterium]